MIGGLRAACSAWTGMGLADGSCMGLFMIVGGVIRRILGLLGGSLARGTPQDPVLPDP